MSVGIAKVFSTALNGKCNNMPDIVDVPMPIEVKITVLPAARGGELLIKLLFEPLGYKVETKRHQLDEKFTNWGESKYYTVSLSNIVCVKDLLSHLYVLIPVLDNEKHYYINHNEIDKLLDKGKSWLSNHPEREQIVNRYLMNFRSFTRKALEQLNPQQEAGETGELSAVVKKRKGLHEQRLNLVFEKIIESGATKVLDLGCGEGKLLKMLLKNKQFKQIAGMDVSYIELLKAKEKIYWDKMLPKQKERINLFQGALNYKDKRLEGYDAAALVEVIEHLEEDRLEALERVVFECAKPKTVIVTTPNVEYNVLFEKLEEGVMRHTDHRFEWTRQEFHNWGNKVADKNDYSVEFFSIGEKHEEYGAPSQMGVFKLAKI